MCKIIFLLILITIQVNATASEVKIIDGDTINIDGEKIRFFGIDAPELEQECKKKGKLIKCGLLAKKVLEDIIADNKPLCIKKGKDRYERTIAECFINDISLSKYLVLNGYAFVYKKYSKQYVYHEKRAKILKKGLWSMKFEFPWKFRKNKKK
jgi:endonuclease YncB( thermonuclease family)|tara:strand:- start:263 stop:721 length:459 start_codon:yes stop_codon:yes gene_type:complete